VVGRYIIYIGSGMLIWNRLGAEAPAYLLNHTTIILVTVHTEYISIIFILHFHILVSSRGNIIIYQSLSVLTIVQDYQVSQVWGI
jgi:hypothetical protein